MSDNRAAPQGDRNDEDELSLFDLVIPMVESWRLLLLGPILVGAIALGITYWMTPIFTAKTTFLPPQPQQSAGSSALASLGALSGLAGVGPVRTPADQFVALMQSTTVKDRLIDQFKLMEVYRSQYRAHTRMALEQNVRIGIGKKDGLITVEVDDESPERAAAMANEHVGELRRLTSRLALTEAQQRRAFFETQMNQTRERLMQAQIALQASGFNAGSLRAEPRAAADGYARLKAEVTSSEVRLQTLRRSLTDSAPEVQQQLAALSALRSQLDKLEASDSTSNGPDYLSKYRDFKYQETLFDLFARQFELARLDEGQEGALIQVVDAAVPPELKSRPRRVQTATTAALASAGGLIVFVFLRDRWRRSKRDPSTADKFAQLRLALRKP